MRRKDADLPRDFCRREVADEPHLAGQAEIAVHCASNLARDAEGLLRSIRNVDGFDSFAIRELRQELPRAVNGSIFPNESGRRDMELFGERDAQLASEIRHA